MELAIGSAISTHPRWWDPTGVSSEAIIARGAHWTVEASLRQHTLGSFILFANRPVERFSDLKPAEMQELTTIMRVIEAALNETFRPTRMNYLQMGNGLHHLHLHGIPRYATAVQFMGCEWRDGEYGHPVRWKTHNAPGDVVQCVASEVRRALQRVVAGVRRLSPVREDLN